MEQSGADFYFMTSLRGDDLTLKPVSHIWVKFVQNKRWKVAFCFNRVLSRENIYRQHVTKLEKILFYILL